MLVEAGSDVNLLNYNCVGPLYLALLNNKQDCVEYLLENGAKAFMDGSDVLRDRSAIFLAIRSG
jgi:ankyrin repeat protein